MMHLIVRINSAPLALACWVFVLLPSEIIKKYKCGSETLFSKREGSTKVIRKRKRKIVEYSSSVE
jgi:hypothetical protein